MANEYAEELNASFRTALPGLLGILLMQVDPDLVVGRLDVTEAVMAPNGYLFAPAVVALADTLCGSGTAVGLGEAAAHTTIELKTNFLGSARAGETVEGKARPVHRGRTTQVWDCEVRNLATGRTIALFRCTQMILPGGRA